MLSNCSCSFNSFQKYGFGQLAWHSRVATLCGSALAVSAHVDRAAKSKASASVPHTQSDMHKPPRSSQGTTILEQAKTTGLLWEQNPEIPPELSFSAGALWAMAGVI
jgi:hypothetical protein